MAVILITGANGQLGNELKTVSKNFYGYDFIFTDIDSLDITNSLQTAEYIKNLKPGWIINCAAYNLVDQAEREPDAAMLVNSVAVKNITHAIKDNDCKLIHISSDYVYEGNACIPYTENIMPEPLSEYGRSKLAGEKHALEHSSAMVIRTSWLYSTFGKNFLKKILEKAGDRENIKVVFDQAGTPTYAADLASAIMFIVAGVIRNQLAFNPGIYNFSNEGVCSWFDFASEIIKEAGFKCRVIPVLSSEFTQAARRPSYSVMDKTKIKETYGLDIPHWRESLKNCIRLLMK